jgi:hypothetical protein
MGHHCISDGLTLINNFVHADAHWDRISNKRIVPARSRVQRQNDGRARHGRPWLSTDFELKDGIPRDSLVKYVAGYCGSGLRVSWKLLG